MEDVKDKYQIRFFLSLIAFGAIFACIFFSFYDDASIFVKIPLILLDLLLLFSTYQGLVYRLSLRKKHEILINEKINLSDYLNKKIENNKKNNKLINKLFIYSLYASPIIIILGISLGIFVSNSVILSIVLPAFIITYLIILFFIKDFMENVDYAEEKEFMETFIINKKSIIYMGKVYMINDCGFIMRDFKYKFFFIPLAKPNFSDELKQKIEGALDEIRNK